MYEESLIQKFRENPEIQHACIRKKKVGQPRVGPVTLANGELLDGSKQMSVWLMLLPQLILAPLSLMMLPTRSLMGL